MTITSMTALKKMPYAQAKIIRYSDGSYALRSYDAIVMGVTAEGWFYVNGLYSATTRKHISAFMRETGLGNYYTAKDLYVKNARYNIHTGEIEHL